MKSRTVLLVAAFVAFPMFAQPVRATPEQQWDFRVFLDDQSIGYHSFRLIPQGDNARELQSQAHFDVKFLFFTAYRYRHSDTELWRGNCLQRIEAKTNDNGKQYFVRGSHNGKEFEVIGDNTEITTASCVKTFAYWDPSILKAQRLLNSQTGEFVDVRVEALGEETIPANGQLVRANHYRLHSELGEIDLWYAVDGDRWLALQSKTVNGRKLSYRMY
ncbi:MAG: DUF6134 family protein [Acidiferrobacterales bacterium]